MSVVESAAAMYFAAVVGEFSRRSAMYFAAVVGEFDRRWGKGVCGGGGGKYPRIHQNALAILSLIGPWGGSARSHPTVGVARFCAKESLGAIEILM